MQKFDGPSTMRAKVVALNFVFTTVTGRPRLQNFARKVSVKGYVQQYATRR